MTLSGISSCLLHFTARVYCWEGLWLWTHSAVQGEG